MPGEELKRYLVEIVFNDRHVVVFQTDDVRETLETLFASSNLSERDIFKITVTKCKSAG